MKYRIFYKKFYKTEKEALKALEEVKGKATNPKISRGIQRKDLWLVILYDNATYERCLTGVAHYNAMGLECYIQRMEG